MPASPDVLGRLDSALGAERTAALLRRLAPVPGALDWLEENAVVEALIRSDSAVESPATRAMLALAGVRDLETLTGELAPPLAARRAALLSADPDSSVPASPDDILVMARELILMDRSNGAPGVLALINGRDFDWRAPMACAWDSLASREDLVRLALAANSPTPLAAIVTALRSSGSDDEAAQSLLRVSAVPSAKIIARLVKADETTLAAAVARMREQDEAIDASKSGFVSPTRSALYQDWEARRAGLAGLAEAIAEAAEGEMDFVSALEARRQALQLDPSEARLASVALTHLKAGEAADALALLPDASDSPAVRVALGMAYVEGGALEKGRPILVDGISDALLEGGPDDAVAVARTLTKCGEVGLALEVLTSHLRRSPTDLAARHLHAELLLEAGDASAALFESRLLHSLDPNSGLAPDIEAKAWIESKRPGKALPILRNALARGDSGAWLQTVECAMDAAAVDEAEAMLAAPPSDVDPAEVAVLRARTHLARGDRALAETALQAATLDHAASPAPWLALAALQERDGRLEEAGETLRRGAQTTASAPVQTALARWLRSNGRPSEALEAAQAAIDQDPQKAEARFELGASLLALGQGPAALDSLREAHRAIPARQDIRLALGQAFEAYGDPEAARRLFAHLPETAPADAWFAAGRLELSTSEATGPDRAQVAVSRLLRARALGISDPALDYWLGRGFEATHQPDRAVEAYNLFVASRPREASLLRGAVLGKSAALVALDRAIESLPDLETLRDRNPEDGEVGITLARAFAAALLPDEASHAAQAVLQKDPAQREALSIVAASAQRTGNWSIASRALQTAAVHVGHDPDLWLESAQAAVRVGDPETARQDVEMALSLGPDGVDRRKAAFALVDLGDPHQALALLQLAAQADPENAGLWLEVADVAERSRDADQALAALEKASALMPDDVDVHARRASVLAAAGRNPESIAAWRAAHALRPQDARIHGALAKALAENEEPQAGLEEFARALAAHPLNADLLAGAGLAALRLGSVREAIDLLIRADRADPDNPQVVVGMAEAWLRLHRPADALETLNRSGRAVEASSVAWSLRAEACLAIGDLIGAEEALAEARRTVGASPAERIALSRAELRFGHWQNAIDTLALFTTDPEPEAEAALAEAVVRSLEARWLYSTAAQAERHAPPPQVPGEAMTAWLESVLARTSDGVEAWHLIRLRLELIHSAEHDGDAFEALRAASGTDLRDGESAREALAIGALRRHRSADALQALKAIEPDDLGPSWQAPLAGIAHLQSGNARMALAAFEDAARDAALRPLALGLYAQASLAADDARGAIDALNQALAQWPDEPAWQSALAALYAEARMPDAALPHLQMAAELEPGSAAVTLALARGLRALGHAGEALEAFDRALPFQADDTIVWTEAGEVALTCGAAARASRYFERALELDPNGTRPMLGAARAAMLGGNLRLARRHAEKALETGEDAELFRCLAEIAARQGEPDRALEMFDRAMKLADDPRSLKLARARLLIDLGRPADAADDLRLCLSENADDENAWHTLSLACEAGGDLAEAIHASESAVRLAPRSIGFRLQLARIARATGHLDRALDELTQAQEIEPLDPEISLEIGRVHEARREFDRALEAYQRSVDLEPGSAEAYRRAASVLKSLKAYSDAGRMLERAAEIDPTDTPTLQQLAAVRALELVHGETYTMAVNP